MRGAQTPQRLSWGIRRIIPADAGSTCSTADCRPMYKDHPRGCGEHDVVPLVSRPARGSSPRMREAPLLCRARTLESGIIPADAGSTLAELAKTPGGDHPRGCGEHDSALDQSALKRGSSPRMRGALIAGEVHGLGHRIIPADAGSTLTLYGSHSSP